MVCSVNEQNEKGKSNETQSYMKEGIPLPLCRLSPFAFSRFIKSGACWWVCFTYSSACFTYLFIRCCCCLFLFLVLVFFSILFFTYSTKKKKHIAKHVFGRHSLHYLFAVCTISIIVHRRPICSIESIREKKMWARGYSFQFFFSVVVCHWKSDTKKPWNSP